MVEQALVGGEMAHWGDLPLAAALTSSRIYFGQISPLDETRPRATFFRAFDSEANRRGATLQPMKASFQMQPAEWAAAAC
eukprot:6110965-Prymnesium_polylepis.2